MEGLKVQQSEGIISTNLDEIEAQIKQQMLDYKDYVVCEDSLKDDKKVLADLRKLEKSLDDSRKAVKKAWLKPYEDFENRCKSVIALVQEPIDLINTQIKIFDEEKKAEKVERIKELYAENIQGLERFLPFEKVIESNPKWVNVSTKDSDIAFDLNAMILKVKNDLIVIHALNSEIEQECVDTYANFGNDLSMAIQRNSQYLSDKQKLEEKAKDNVVESKQIKEATVKEMAQIIKSAKIIVAIDDLAQVEELLNFSNIKYQVVKEQ